MNMMHTENVYHMEAMNGKKILEEKQRIIETPYYKKIKGMKNGKKYSFSLPKRVSFTKFSPRKIQRTLTPYYPKKKSMKMKKNARCRDTKKKIRKNRGGGAAASCNLKKNMDINFDNIYECINNTEYEAINDLLMDYNFYIDKLNNKNEKIKLKNLFIEKYRSCNNCENEDFDNFVKERYPPSNRNANQDGATAPNTPRPQDT